MIELNQAQYDFLALLERLPAEYTVTDTPSITTAPAAPVNAAPTAKPKSNRGRPPVAYDNRELVAYMDKRQQVIPVGELYMPDWLEDIISGSLTWRESGKDNTHKLSPSRMRIILTTLPVISTAAVMELPSDKRKGKRRGAGISERAAQYYVSAAVVASKMALRYMQSAQWKPDEWERMGLFKDELDWDEVDEPLAA